MKLRMFLKTVVAGVAAGVGWPVKVGDGWPKPPMVVPPPDPVLGAEWQHIAWVTHKGWRRVYRNGKLEREFELPKPEEVSEEFQDWIFGDESGQYWIESVNQQVERCVAYDSSARELPHLKG